MKRTFTFLFSIALFLMIDSAQAQVRLLTVDPSTGTVGIKNFGDVEVDISSHRLCHLFTYPVISSLTIVSGNPSNLGPGEILVVTGVNLNASASDLGLYVPSGAFSDPNNMLDFTQWGSSGNGREPVAVEKGIWEAGTFISDPAPFQYVGNGQDEFGVGFWVTFVDAIDEIDPEKDIITYPNPVVDVLNIKSQETSIKSFKIVNMLGEVVYEQIANNPIGNNIVYLSQLNKGNYILYLNTSNGAAIKKIVLAK